LTVDEFFAGHPESRVLFDAVEASVAAVGDAKVRVTKSQVAFRRTRAFAWAWMPDQYLGGGHAPLVLTLALRRHDSSPRWKEIVEPAPGRFTHHLELRSAADVDAQVRRWLEEAWEQAG
jgi:hypothetical protein